MAFLRILRCNPWEEVVLIWFVKKMLKIKTKCGLEKKKKLEKNRGFFPKIRLYWFLLAGGLRDILNRM